MVSVGLCKSFWVVVLIEVKTKRGVEFVGSLMALWISYDELFYFIVASEAMIVMAHIRLEKAHHGSAGLGSSS